MRIKLLLGLVLFFGLAPIIRADSKWFLKAPKNSPVVLKFSSDYLNFRRMAWWKPRKIYGVKIDTFSDGVVTVKGESNWRDRGWCWMQELRLARTGYDNKMPFVELQTDEYSINLFFGPETKDLNAAFNEVAYVGGLEQFKQTDYYQKEIVERNLPRMFFGQLAAIPVENQLKLVEAMKYQSGAIDGEEFKGKFYLVLRATNDFTYNTQVVNQAERAARTIENIINVGVKNIRDAINAPNIDGVKMETKIFMKDFSNEAEAEAIENVDIYLLFDNLKQYQEADITNQELIDKSYVMVNGNRVQVSLTQFNR